MTNFVVDAAMDQLLNHISGNATFMHICSGDPANYAQVISNSLGNVAVSGANFTLADGVVSGRRHTLEQLQIVAASASGTAAVLALVDASVMLYKADLASTQVITAGNPITVNEHDHEVRDPA